MRILVTGHNGYIGSVLAPVLQAEGHEVVGLDTFYFEDCTFEKDEVRIPAIRKDIREVEVADLDGFQGVVHLAALGHDPFGDLHPEWTAQINHQAAVNLARMARNAGVSRFLLASSCSLYGVPGHDDAVTEDAPLHPVTPWAVSKARAEEDVSKLADASLSPVFMRTASAYGVSPRLRADVMLNNLVCCAHTTGRIRMLSDGSPWRAVVHVQDVARAFVSVLAAPRTAIHNQAFNIGASGENYQLHELAAIVQSSVPGCTVAYAAEGVPDPRSYRVDFGKLARTFPEFKPHWNASFGAKDLYAALQEQRLTLADFRERKYVRRAQMNYLLTQGWLDRALRWTHRA